MTSKILTVSAADERYAALYLPKVIDGVEVQHLSWGGITRLADEAYPLCQTNEQKMWLKQLNEHLRGYELGPAMRPPKEVRNGKVVRNTRTWGAIDTLLSGEFETISDAANETKRRLEE